MWKILYLFCLLAFCKSFSQDLEGKKFYALIRHSCMATTKGAYDIFVYRVFEFKNKKVYPSYLHIPFEKQINGENAINYKFENKILYLAKPLQIKDNEESVFIYKNGNLIPKNKNIGSDFIFKPSLDHFKRNK